MVPLIILLSDNEGRNDIIDMQKTILFNCTVKYINVTQYWKTRLIAANLKIELLT